MSEVDFDSGRDTAVVNGENMTKFSKHPSWVVYHCYSAEILFQLVRKHNWLTLRLPDELYIQFL